VAPGGMMVVATLNRTLKAFALAVVGAEYVLRWLPRGTHDWRKFLTPDEIRAFLASEPVAVEGPFGVGYDPLADRWSRTADAGVNYMMVVTPLEPL
jgi:2-polyprenyl-6-hydroxyphenyl methylase / 3-demethylubiquinone-9 3-methyltransferase